MEEEKTVVLSVLITREEYIQNSVRYHPPAVTGVGAVLSVAGLVGLFFGEPVGLTPAAAICIVALGLILLVYNGVLAPFLDRGAAAREFDSREELRMATAYRFTAENIWVENGRVTGEIPLSLATDFQRTPEQIAFRFGRELSFIIPIRLLSGEQADFIEKAFSRMM